MVDEQADILVVDTFAGARNDGFEEDEHDVDGDEMNAAFHNSLADTAEDACDAYGEENNNSEAVVVVAVVEPVAAKFVVLDVTELAGCDSIVDYLSEVLLDFEQYLPSFFPLVSVDDNEGSSHAREIRHRLQKLKDQSHEKCL